MNALLRDWCDFNRGGSKFLSSAAKEAYLAGRGNWHAQRAAVAAEDEYIISLADKVRAGEALPVECACRQRYFTAEEIFRREKVLLKRIETNEKNRMATARRKIKIEEGKIALHECKEQFEASWSRAEEARAEADEDIPLSTLLKAIKRRVNEDTAHQDEAVKSLAGLPMDIADIILKKHAVLHDLHCEKLVEDWKNAMKKYMIDGRKEDKDKADNIQHKLKNTKSAIVFTHTINSQMNIDARSVDYTGSLSITQTLVYTIGVLTDFEIFNGVSRRSVYSTHHNMKLPSPLTQLGNPENKNMRFEVYIYGDGDGGDTKMIKTAEELFDIMQHEKPYVTYSYYANVGVCAKNVSLSLRCSDNKFYDYK